LKKTLTATLFEKNQQILQLLEKQTAKEIQDVVARHTEKIAKKFIKRLKSEDSN